MYDRKKDGLVIADVGGGVGWTSAIMALHPRVRKVILVEPSDNRRASNKHIVDHFGVPKGKVESISGTFQNFNLKEKVDVVVLCASIHHCYDEFIPKLFENIDECLVDPIGNARVLIANEHIVTPFWVLHRMGAYIKNILLGKKDNIFYGINNWRAPHPHDGEHWRNRKEIDQIVKEAGYSHRFFVNQGDLCVKNPSIISRLEWVYYYALLDKK